jgi:uncharacterized damage-inducible protein DinB
MSQEMLVKQFFYTHYVLKHNSLDVSDEESLRPPSDGGNSLNWILGHILSTRNSLLQLVGEASFWPKKQIELYKRGSEPVTDGATAIAYTQLLSDLDSSQATLIHGLENLSADHLAQPAESPTGGDDETIGSVLAMLLFHEAYHAGQTGTMRHILGKEGRIT